MSMSTIFVQTLAGQHLALRGVDDADSFGLLKSRIEAQVPAYFARRQRLLIVPVNATSEAGDRIGHVTPLLASDPPVSSAPLPSEFPTICLDDYSFDQFREPADDCTLGREGVHNGAVLFLLFDHPADTRFSTRVRHRMAQCAERARTTLRLNSCRIDTVGSEAVADFVRSDEWHMTGLEAADCHIQPAGAKFMASALTMRHDSLEKIVLPRNKLGDQGCEAMAAVVECALHLRSLDLSYNGIGSLGAAALGAAMHTNAAQTLQRLDLGGNQFSGDDIAALATGGARSLRSLHLGFCQVDDDGACAIARVLSEAEPASRLRDLFLYFNNISDRGACALGTSLAINTTLCSLALSNNERMGTAGLCSVLVGLAGNKSLRSLELKNSKISSESASALAEALRANGALRHLNLETCNIHDEHAALLAAGLSQNATLRAINLSGNDLGDLGMEHIAAAVARGGGVRVLELRQTLANRDRTPANDGIVRLAATLSANACLRELDLCGTHLSRDDALALGSALANNATLRALYLGECALGASGAAALSHGLLTNAALRVLFLVDNEIGDAGACAFAAVLARNLSLRSLNLSGNAIGNVGLAAVAGALESNAGLRLLMLKRNERIDDDGAAILAAALAPNGSSSRMMSGLRGLELFGCDGITERGGALLAAAVEHAESPLMYYDGPGAYIDRGSAWEDEINDMGEANDTESEGESDSECSESDDESDDSEFEDGEFDNGD